MPDWLYDTGKPGVFLLVTVLLGGAAAFMTGRAIAQTWRPYWHIPLYALPLASTVRFFHYALFAEPFMSPRNFLVDFAVVLVTASLGYRLYRAKQMVRQYGWLFQRRGPFAWRALR
jgi:hypothetical protein